MLYNKGVADVRNARKFREIAADLRDRCALRGVILVAGEIEDILAAGISEIAQQLGVTERTVLDRYLTEVALGGMVDAISRAGAIQREAAATAEPVLVDAASIARVFASVGMAMKLATEAMEKEALRTDALGVATDCADAVVGVAAALAAAHGAEQVEVGGPTLVYVRKVLTQTIAALRDGDWACPCRDRHGQAQPCRLQRQLTGDLALVGGWTIDKPEPPGTQR